MPRRWIADEFSGDIAALLGDHATHLSRVLRAQIGQEFEISVGDEVRRGVITTIANDRVEFALGERLDMLTRRLRGGTPQITLVLAIFKFDRMEWAIEKCTEIGVSRIVPVITRRTDTHLAAAATKRHERWRRIARQAAEQSRQAAPPEIAAPVKLKDICSVLSHASTRIVLSEQLAGASDGCRLRDLLAPGSDVVTLAIGPEGGWTDSEINWFVEEGWHTASLGNTILRAETAAIVAAALTIG